MNLNVKEDRANEETNELAELQRETSERMDAPDDERKNLNANEDRAN